MIRAANADVLVLASIDQDLAGHTLKALADRLDMYPHRFAGPNNRGVDVDTDRNGDGKTRTPDDAQGYGEFTGQGGLAVLSRFPIQRDRIEDYSAFLWRDLPDNIADPGVVADQRLSTTAHLVVPVTLESGAPLSIATWHATPPVFDGPEDRNGRRNHDETAFWLKWLETDAPDAFVLTGVVNLDPVDGDGRAGALDRLLTHPKLTDVNPTSAGGAAAAAQGGVNDTQTGNPALDTADWSDDAGGPGNLRVDYVLPSTAFAVMASGIFWPEEGALFSGDVLQASRHRLVWVDLCAKRDAECINGVGLAKPGE